MNRLLIVILAASLLITLSLTGCQALEKGSGKLKTEDFEFDDFPSVEVDGPFEVNISCAESYRISITADENIFDKIEILKEDKTLKIGLQTKHYLGIQRTKYVDTTTKIVITMPQLRSLLLSGAAKDFCSAFNSRASIDFNISRASSLDFKSMSVGDAYFNVYSASNIMGKIISGDNVFNIDGASTVELDGTGNNIVCNVSGASQLKLEKFAIANANVLLKGASTGIINSDGKLDVDLRGDSDLYYFGEPVMGKTKISDDSKMVRKPAID